MFAAILRALLPFRRPGTKFDQKVWLQYDWLRLEQPEAGGLVARIRAEYTMFGGFAVALLICLTIIVTRAVFEWATYSGNTLQYMQTASARSSLVLAVVTALAAFFMLRRHCDAYQTFGRGVQNFYQASRGRDRWKDDFLAPSEKKGFLSLRAHETGQMSSHWRRFSRPIGIYFLRYNDQAVRSRLGVAYIPGHPSRRRSDNAG